jgi:hypothetical protein
MTTAPHDQLAKRYLEEFLAPLGKVERQYEVPGEAKQVDVWFVPERPGEQADLGILGRMTQGMCLLEAFRNGPTRAEIRTCLLKLLWVQEDQQRQAAQSLAEPALPRLWILAATVSQPVLTESGGLVKVDWLPGIYFMPELLKSAIVVIDQLPETVETLWVRILGRGVTQERAIREVLALSRDYPRRSTVLRLLAAWKVTMSVGELADFTEQGEIMALSEAFLTWEQEKETQTKEVMALKMLQEGATLDFVAKVTGFTAEQLQGLRARAN